MESMNFMVGSMGQIARTMEQNAMGFSQLFQSINSISNRAQSPFKRFYSWIKSLLLRILNKVLVVMKVKKECE